MNMHRTATGFAHVVDWVFDLDNTLYPRHCNLFGQIDARMTDYVARLTGLAPEEARAMQKRLYRDHGTTLAGLMREHDIDPHQFLADVHDIDYSVLPADPELGEAISALSGSKHIFTNGDVSHARKALAAIGISDLFDATFDIVAAQFDPKPSRAAFDRFLAAHGIDPARAAMFEDLPRNLEPAKALGMVTVLVTPCGQVPSSVETWEIAGADADHIDHVVDDLTGFLRTLTPRRSAQTKHPAGSAGF